MKTKNTKGTPDAKAVALSRLVQRFRCLGRHKWVRVSTQPNGVGFLQECQKCGRGSGLNWLGYASHTVSMSAEEMLEWRKQVSR